MSDIFISYASADRSRAEPLVRALEQQGRTVWWDRSILPGKTWSQVIEAALADARCVIVLWSRESVRSEWVLAEAEEAKRRGILVPALIDPVSIPLEFRRMQAADLVNWPEPAAGSGFDQLVKAVSAVLHSSAPPPRAASFEPGVLRAAVKDLAFYIGPMAEVIVNRAAKQAQNQKELYEAVAAEITSPADRAKFLAHRG